MRSGFARTALAAAGLALAAVASGGCSGDGAANATAAVKKVPVTITSANGKHIFTAEIARTPAEQERGLMFRTDLGKDDAMIFTPYPADGGPPREASFWMKNTPTPLDIIFIRADGTIATIAENAVPFSTDPIPSGEPVAAVLEIVGGRAAELGIATGDKVTWPK
ncbi:DUF192 domain-containing protein [Sphingomonas cannabina]|uniref:DUF192 domain-containing protein n=1 Tax=Sphingomonas cannabina TaxID=2899123 RepID=UPI001F3FCB72|nr:DUF192 domain-containing protein [Sphingomonas cannabina]UIJ44462.1 DUF192 domain-containing protein [Sphingomonas cannabina]